MLIAPGIQGDDERTQVARLLGPLESATLPPRIVQNVAHVLQKPTTPSHVGGCMTQHKCMPNKFQIRALRAGDAPQLYRVFHAAVHGSACADYGPEQLAAWAPAHTDPIAWRQKIMALQPLIVTCGTAIAAYADLQSDGLIDHFFVAPAYGRQGVGTLLLNTLEQRAHLLALRSMHAYVSITAQAFFRQQGFRVEYSATVEVRGVALRHAVMRKNFPLRTQ